MGGNGQLREQQDFIIPESGRVGGARVSGGDRVLALAGEKRRCVEARSPHATPGSFDTALWREQRRQRWWRWRDQRRMPDDLRLWVFGKEEGLVWRPVLQMDGGFRMRLLTACRVGRS